MNRSFYRILCLILLLSLLCACNPGTPEPAPTADPHAGMVEVPSGTGTDIWVPLYEDLPASAFTPEQFTAEEPFIRYTGTDFTARTGIDVSFYQGDIDWAQVAAAGVDFAIIRLGYRGYSEGKISLDERFHEYMTGARAAGLDVGVYFFSQAVSDAEAEEEARFVLENLAGYDITMPIAFDWEHIGAEEGARTDNVPQEILTDACLAFCRVIREAGYTPAVYFYRSLGYWNYDLPRLHDADVLFWFAGVGNYPDFYYAHSMWQYSYTARIPGIEADVDLDILFEPVPAPDPSPASSEAPAA